MSFLRSLPVQLVIIIISVALFGHLVPMSIVQAAVTASLCIKQLLALVLPIMVFSYILTGVTSFKRQGPLAIIALLVSVIISNGLVALVSFAAITRFTGFITAANELSVNTGGQSIQPFFEFTIPQYIGAEHALALALAIGMIHAFYPMDFFLEMTKQVKSWVQWYLETIIIPVLPLFVLGFLLKIRAEGIP